MRSFVDGPTVSTAGYVKLLLPPRQSRGNSHWGLGNDRRMIQISTPVQAANSGSPLLDRSGSVVGIVAGKLNAIQVAETTGETTENVTFAVSLGTIQSFLDSHAVPYVSNDSTQSKNYADIATEAMRYTVLLECAR